MRRESAERAIRQWVRSKYFKAALTDDEYNVLATSLMGTPNHIMATPSVVNDILQRLFPQHENFTGSGEKNMSTNRVVPPLASRAAAPQSVEDIVQVVKKYEQTGHWQSCASQFESPARSKANFALLANAIKDFRATGQHLRVDHVAEIVMRLASAGVFERVPTVQAVEVAKPVEVAPEPDARELHNRQVRIEKSLQDRTTSPIRGAREKAAPLLKTDNTNIVESAASEKAAQDNNTISIAISRIDAFRGHSHSRTASGKAQLRAVFQEQMDNGASAEAVLAAVEAEANKLVDSGSIR